MKTKLITFLTLLLSIAFYAQDFTFEDVDYTVTSTTSNTVQITGAGSVSSNFVIPSTAENNGIVYTVTSVAFRAFRQKRTIVSLTIPVTIVAIGNEAFVSNPIREIISLGVIPPTIQNGTFSDRELIDITIPAGAEIDYAIAGWTDFLSVNGNSPIGTTFDVAEITYKITSSEDPKTVALSNSNEVSGNLLIPETVSLNGVSFSVSSIGNNAINGSLFTNITVTSGTPLSLGTTSFGDNSLVFLTVPEGLVNTYLTAGWTGFLAINGFSPVGTTFDVAGLTYKVTSSEDPKTVALSNSNEVSGNLLIPETVSLNGVSFSVSSIGNNAINGSLFTNITVTSNTPPSVGTTSFGDNSLVNLTVPDGLLDAYLTAGWTGFLAINNQLIENLIDGVFTINRINYRVTGLSPNEVKVIRSTSVLPDLVIPEEIHLNSFTFNVTVIGEEAFQDVTLNNVEIPDTVTIIEESAFRRCNLLTITLGSGLETVEESALKQNTQLINMIVKATAPPTLGNNALEIAIRANIGLADFLNRFSF